MSRDWLARVIQLLGLNAIPFAGVFWSDWSDATAILFYWCETAIVTIFVALRLTAHRRATNKRGHYVATKTSVDGGPAKHGVTTLTKSFLMSAGGFSFGNLVFLVVLVVLFNERVDGGQVDVSALKDGLIGAGIVIAIGFALDMWTVAHRPFAWANTLVEGAMRRVLILYAAVFIGAIGAMMFNRPHTLFSVFFGLRLFTDITSNFRPYDPQRPPSWMSRWFKDRAKFDAQWEADRQTRLKTRETDEEPFDGRPSLHAQPGMEA